MKKLKIIIIVLLLLIVCLLAKNAQYHSQIIEKDSQIEKLKQELKENPTKTKKNSIPILEKAIQCYWDCTPQEKNDILKSIILKCIYKKEKSGRWNPEAIDNFELDIFFRI